MRISELADRTGCAVQTIRYYERQGLLPEPARTTANYRTYRQDHVARLKFIRHCRHLDMTLVEIRELLTFCDGPERSCHAVNKLLDEHIRHVNERIAELHALEKYLRQLRQTCRTERTAKHCGILQRLATTDANPREARERTHVGATHTQAR